MNPGRHHCGPECCRHRWAHVRAEAPSCCGPHTRLDPIRASLPAQAGEPPEGRSGEQLRCCWAWPGRGRSGRYKATGVLGAPGSGVSPHQGLGHSSPHEQGRNTGPQHPPPSEQTPGTAPALLGHSQMSSETRCQDRGRTATLVPRCHLRIQLSYSFNVVPSDHTGSILMPNALTRG